MTPNNLLSCSFQKRTKREVVVSKSGQGYFGRLEKRMRGF